MSGNDRSGRPAATHVQAAIAAGRGPGGRSPGGRSAQAHGARGPERPVAAHVARASRRGIGQPGTVESGAVQSGAVQPYISRGNVVYYPDTTNFGQGMSQQNFERALRVLAAPPGQMMQAATRISWNQFATTQAGYEARAMGAPRGGRNQRQVKAQFQDTTKVYHYNPQTDIQNLAPDATRLLLDFADMAEADGAPLPQNVNHQNLAAAKCVIESLSDLGVNVPNTQNHGVGDWHTYHHNQGLDYRQDNHYIVTYVGRLGYPLISTTPQRWNSWTPAPGRYLVMTSQNQPVQGAVGHAIGVVVTQGQGQGPNVKTIHDRQNLTANWGNFWLKYIFRVA